MRRNKRTNHGNFGMVVSGLLFIIILVAVGWGILGVSQEADAEGLSNTKQAIEQAAVLCYATEGFYPPTLNYITEHYGVQIDSRYIVSYEVFSSGIMPTIVVATAGR